MGTGLIGKEQIGFKLLFNLVLLSQDFNTPLPFIILYPYMSITLSDLTHTILT